MEKYESLKLEVVMFNTDDVVCEFETSGDSF